MKSNQFLLSLSTLLFIVVCTHISFVPSALAQHTQHGGAAAATDSKSYTLDKESLEALYWARLDSAKMNFSEDEVRFMTMMIPHHAQALIMSDLAIKNGAGPQVLTLSSRIINAQKDEIRLMQTWLSDRKQPYPAVEVDGLDLVITTTFPEAGHGVDVDASVHQGMNHDGMDHAEDHGDMEHGEDHAEHGDDHDMDHEAHHADENHDDMDHEAHHAEENHDDMDHASSSDMASHDMAGHNGHDMMDHTTMVGMLTPAQMKELSEARGIEFDRLFLKYMIQHHNGAVIMVTELFDSDGAGWDDAAYKIASDIQVDQRTEIARMELMLEQISEEKPE